MLLKKKDLKVTKFYTSEELLEIIKKFKLLVLYKNNLGLLNIIKKKIKFR